MDKCLLSVDWDYFIYTRNYCGSYIESNRSLVDLWYKRYIQAKARGEDIRKAFLLSADVDGFWAKIKEYFKFADNIRILISDSHALSYQMAVENNCKSVYLFDAHADLGYGGLSSLNFEVNCSNWLGKLLKEKIIEEAWIIYSPYTSEKPDYFKAINSLYQVRYGSFADMAGKAIGVSAIHLCRSGAWVPPWLDEKFNRFIAALGLPYTIVDCPERKWDPEHIRFAEQIDYLLA